MSRELLRAYGLSGGQLEQIAALAQVCNHAEGLTTRLNWPSLRGRPADRCNDFLYYEGDRLVGFFGIYTFGQHPKEAEASAMVHPDYRRQGIFKEMLAAARAEVRRRALPSILFFCQRGSPAAAPVMDAIAARYEFTEYNMRAEPENVAAPAHAAPAQPDPAPGLALRDAVLADEGATLPLDLDCFGVRGAPGDLERALADPGQHAWVITLDARVIGMLRTRTDETSHWIFGLCIGRAHRGRGLGRAALSAAMARLLQQRRQPIMLEVSATNEAALNLYRGRGFEMTIAYDYYRLEIGD